jgi:hypothetical protein
MKCHELLNEEAIEGSSRSVNDHTITPVQNEHFRLLFRIIFHATFS